MERTIPIWILAILIIIPGKCSSTMVSWARDHEINDRSFISTNNGSVLVYIGIEFESDVTEYEIWINGSSLKKNVMSRFITNGTSTARGYYPGINLLPDVENGTVEFYLKFTYNSTVHHENHTLFCNVTPGLSVDYDYDRNVTNSDNDVIVILNVLKEISTITVYFDTGDEDMIVDPMYVNMSNLSPGVYNITTNITQGPADEYWPTDMYIRVYGKYYESRRFNVNHLTPDFIIDFGEQGKNNDQNEDDDQEILFSSLILITVFSLLILIEFELMRGRKRGNKN